MLPEQIIILAIAINLLGSFLYIRNILTGGAKPNLASWVPWMLAPFLGAYFQFKAGAGFSLIPIFLAGFGPFFVIILSIIKKNSFWKINYFDILCFSFSIIALLLYVYTHNLAISIIFAIISDALAFIPTFIKSWTNPESEFHSTYSLGVISNIIGLLIIKNWTFPIYSFGIYLVIFNIAEVVILKRKRIRELMQLKS